MFEDSFARMRADEDDGGGETLSLLHMINVRPFDIASVEAYKAQQIKENTPFIPMTPERVALLGEVLNRGVALSIAAAGVCGFLALSVSSWFWLALPLAALHVIADMYIWNKSLRGHPSWQRVSHDDYEDFIPVQVLGALERVRAMFPRASFYIDKLVQNETIIDPFLVANIDGVDYYIAVWDEDDFLV